MSDRPGRRPARRAAAGLGLLAFLTLAGPAQAQVKPASAQLTQVTGRVEILRRGQTVWVPAVVGAGLAERDEIRSHPGGWAVLTLPDTSTLMVAENSRVLVITLAFDARVQTRNVLFHLVAGKVRAVVAQAALTLVRTRQSTFTISSPTGVAAARGTDWVAFFDRLKRLFGIGVVTGNVECLDIWTQIAVLVAVNFMTTQCSTPVLLTPDDIATLVSTTNTDTGGQPPDGPTTVNFVGPPPPPPPVPIVVSPSSPQQVQQRPRQVP